jgi:hypothetical protein
MTATAFAFVAGRWLCVFILTKKIHLHLCEQNALLLCSHGLVCVRRARQRSDGCHINPRAVFLAALLRSTPSPASARSRGDDDDAYDDDASNNIPQLCAAPRLILI